MPYSTLLIDKKDSNQLNCNLSKIVVQFLLIFWARILLIYYRWIQACFSAAGYEKWLCWNDLIQIYCFWEHRRTFNQSWTRWWSLGDRHNLFVDTSEESEPTQDFDAWELLNCLLAWDLLLESHKGH